ncbi:MAG: tetratricopeptide repeat protein [Candidatus Eisenbacteria bacterium]
MTGWLGSLFGKSPEKRIEEAERFAATERWPEAIDVLDKTMQGIPAERGALRSEIERRIARYSESYLSVLEEGIARSIEEEDFEKAEELVSIAVEFTRDEKRKNAIRGLLKRPAPREDARKEEPGPAPDAYSDELIDSLLHGYVEGLEASEKEAILTRPFSFQKAFVLWQEGDAEGSRRAAEKYVAENARDPYGHLYLGFALATIDRTEEAAGAFETALALDPSLLHAGLGLAAMERRRGNLSRAIALLDEVVAAIRSEPDRHGERRREESFLLALQVLVEAGEGDRAERLYRELLREGLLRKTLSVEARIAEARDDHAAAAEKWDLHLSAGPGTGAITGHGARAGAAGPDDHEEAADFHYRRGTLKRALDLYERAALLITERVHFSGERIPASDLFRIKKKTALTLIETGRKKEAERIAEELERARPVPPEAAEIREALGKGA